MLIKYNYDNIQISTSILLSMTGSKKVSRYYEMKAKRSKEDGKMGKETNLFERISCILIEAFRSNGE